MGALGRSSTEAGSRLREDADTAVAGRSPRAHARTVSPSWPGELVIWALPGLVHAIAGAGHDVPGVGAVGVRPTPAARRR